MDARKLRLGIVSFGAFVAAATVFGGSPQFPSELDYAKLGPEQQDEFKSAAFLLNLRGLGLLKPGGMICAQPSKDANGNPVYNFSVQEQAFGTGSCLFGGAGDAAGTQAQTIAQLQNLAKATAHFQRNVQGKTGKLPVTVSGFADGQGFSKVGAEAKALCPGIENAKPVNGSYNEALATSRARKISDTISASLGEADVKVEGHDSPKIAKTDFANCPSRRQVVVSFHSGLASGQSEVVGAYEPASQVDSTVQLGLNAGVSVQILRAHAKVQERKQGKVGANKPEYLDCQSKDRNACVWSHLQEVMTELGIDPNDAGCRATTMAIADQVIGRALDPKSKVGPRMLALARGNAPGQTADWAKDWIAEYQRRSSKGKPEALKEHAGCEANAETHLMIPTADMFDTRGSACPRKNLFAGGQSFIASTYVRNQLGMLREAEGRLGYYAKADPRYAQTEAQIAKTKKEIAEAYPGIASFEDLAAYTAAGRADLARRNLSHNCVKPDLDILAAGYELSPAKDKFFQKPKELGDGDVKMGYSNRTFGSTFYGNESSGRKGFGCKACGSGLILAKGKLSYENGIVNQHSSMVKNMDAAFGADGMGLLRGDKAPAGTVTAASFLAPSLYEIPNCPDCSCVTSMKDALHRAFDGGARKIASAADGLNPPGGGKAMNTAALKNSCLFSPPVAHACPVGPGGKGEAAASEATIAKTVSFLDASFNPVTVALTGEATGVLGQIAKGCGGGVPGVPTIAYYQKLVDEVVCDTRPNPLVLPENNGKEMDQCKLADQLYGKSKVAAQGR